MLNCYEINEYEKISSEIEQKLSSCKLTAEDLFCGHLHYGKKFIDPIGIYIVFKRNRYKIYYLNIHGIENVKTLDTRDELVFQIISDGVIAYTHRTNKYNSHKTASELLKKLDVNYLHIRK